MGPEHPTGILDFASSVLGQKTGLVSKMAMNPMVESVQIYTTQQTKGIQPDFPTPPQTRMVMLYFDKMDPRKLGHKLNGDEQFTYFWTLV